MFECVSGHCFHESCANVKGFTKEEKEQIIIEDFEKRIASAEKYKYSWLQTTIEEFEEFKSSSDHDEDYLDEFLDEGVEIRYNYPASKCPICNLSKPNSSDVVDYMYKKFNTNEEEMFEEMRSKFNTIDDLKEYLKK